MRLRTILPVLLFVVSLLLPTGCGGSSSAECSCAGPSFSISIPPPRSLAVQDVTLGGDCANVRALCNDQRDIGGCSSYSVFPQLTNAADYVCFIKVTFDHQEPFETTIRWRKFPNGCCANFSFDRPTNIQVPPLLVDLGATD